MSKGGEGETKLGVFLWIIGCIVYWQIDWFIGFNEVSYLQNRDGFVYEVNSDSKFTGKYVGYYENGTDKNRQLKEEIIYVDGVKDGGYTYWYQNGKKKEEGNFRDGENDGLLTQWYENGQKGIETNTRYIVGWYENTSYIVAWYENGQKKGEGNSKYGKQEGLWTFWDKEGNVTKTETYKKGKLVK